MKKHSPVNNDNGYTMLIALFILVLISVIGFSLLTTAANTNKTTDNERTDQAVFYIAEAGLTQTVSKLNQLVDTSYKDATAIYNSQTGNNKQIKVLTDEFYTRAGSKFIDFNNVTDKNYESTSNMSPSSTIKVNTIVSTPDAGYYEYEIISTGSIGTRTRNVKQKIIIDLGLNGGTGGGPTLFITPGKSVWADSTQVAAQIAMQGSPSGNHVPKDKFIEFDQKEYDILKTTYDSMLQACKVADAPISEHINKITNNTVLVLNENTSISNYDGKNMTFDIGERNITLQLNDENINNATNLKIKGTGKLRIIGNGAKLNALLDIKRENPASNVDFVVKSMNFNGQSNLQLDGNLCVPNSIDINNTLNAKGYMIAYGNEIKINGNSHLSVGSLLAPDAYLFSNSSVTINQNSIVGGFRLNGGASINVGSGVPTISNSLFKKESLVEID